jgi:hypothetical protein
MDHHERLNCIVNLLRIPVAGAMETTRTGYDKAAGSSQANIVSICGAPIEIRVRRGPYRPATTHHGSRNCVC